jgi:phosphate transport system permease protein
MIKMKINTITRFLNYLQKLRKRSLLAGSLAFLAGISTATIGSLRIIDALNTWITNQALVGITFDHMISSVAAGVLLIFPSIIFFVAGFLITESHSLGAKLSVLLSMGTLIYGIASLNATLVLSGVLCFLAAEIESLFRNKKLEKNSPITTEKVAKFGLGLSALIGVIVLFAVIIYITVRGIKYVNWDFITGANWDYISLKGLINGDTQMGVIDFIIGSFLIVGLAELIAIPMGLGAAIYLSEYAPNNKITNTIRFFIETLAGAPSIVIALFGFYLLVWGLGWYQSWLPAALCISFMTLPWNIRVSEEAIKTVPYSFREGAFALGATRWQTVRNIVFLSALPGIITGLVLGLGAALGETTVLYLVADSGNTSLPSGLPLTGPGKGMPTLPILIYRTYFYNIGGGGTNYQWEQTNVAFAAAFVLLIIFLVISAVALITRNYVAKKTSGK